MLDPCPHCGGIEMFYCKVVHWNPTTIWGNAYIVCLGCGAQGPKVSVRKGDNWLEELEQQATKGWNWKNGTSHNS